MKTIVITGAGGVLCSVMARDFLERGAEVALLDINEQAVKTQVEQFKKLGYKASGFVADVLNKDSLEAARSEIEREFGVPDILINGAGGNHPLATTDDEIFDKNVEVKKNFFDLTTQGMGFVFDLNFMGTFLTTQVFAKAMTECGKGNILNISSMNAYTPLTKIPAYSAAKAAVQNFTAWLATYFAKTGIRVNAIAPGFFVTAQNKNLLYTADGKLSPRADKILKNTPMGRFGEAEELLGAVRFLTDDNESAFVTGIVIPVDGGFSGYSGV